MYLKYAEIGTTLEKYKNMVGGVFLTTLSCVLLLNICISKYTKPTHACHRFIFHLVIT